MIDPKRFPMPFDRYSAHGKKSELAEIRRYRRGAIAFIQQKKRLIVTQQMAPGCVRFLCEFSNS
jgi:hypothetical protein